MQRLLHSSSGSRARVRPRFARAHRRRGTHGVRVRGPGRAVRQHGPRAVPHAADVQARRGSVPRIVRGVRVPGGAGRR